MKRKYVRLALIAVAVTFNIGLICWLFLPRYNQNLSDLQFYDTTSNVKPVTRLYGFAVDSFIVEKNSVLRDQNMGKILQKYVLPERAFTQLMMYGDRVFDLRKIRNGNHYTAFVSKDTLNKLQYLVYEHSPIEYVVFDFTDSVKVSLCQKEVVTKRRKASGEITASLWEAIKKDSINPLIALKLSEMYAWTVDFFGLQQGDHFTVVYDEMYVDTVSIGIGRIHAACFHHAGKDLMAIPFMQDSVETYFDAEGKSLRRAFLKAPLRFSRISSRYSASRLHPVLKIRRPHFGVDYAAPTGTPVYAIGDGRIVMAEYQRGAGRIVKVRHNGVYTSCYMHLSGFGNGVGSGKYISQGQLIGYVGSTGLSTGPHLDFRVFKNGSPIDPLKMESPPVDPVRPENLTAFESVKTGALDLLQGVEHTNMAEKLPPSMFIPTALMPPGFFMEEDN